MQLEKITKEAEAIAKSAGRFIQSQLEGFSTDIVEAKGLNQLVSYVDIEAEKRIVTGLQKLALGAGFITEENTAPDSKQELNWIIDPLDGTTNFIHKLPVFSVSIALARGNEILLGVVYEVMKDESFYAWQNGGAWLNGERIHTSNISSLEDSLLATGFPYYDFEQMDAYLSTLTYFMKNTHGLRRLGSAAVDLAYTACGRFEGFFEYGLNSWDIAAGICLIKEAGGSISDFKGGEDYLFGKEIIAANASLLEPIKHVINERFI